MGIMKFFEYIAFFALSTSVNGGWYDYITSFGSSTPSPTVPTPSPTVPTEQIKRIAEFLQLHFRFIKELPDDQKNAFKEALNLKETNPDLIHKLQSVVELVDAEKTNQDKRSVDEKNLISKKDEIIKSHDIFISIFKILLNRTQRKQHLKVVLLQHKVLLNRTQRKQHPKVILLHPKVVLLQHKALLHHKILLHHKVELLHLQELTQQKLMIHFTRKVGLLPQLFAF